MADFKTFLKQFFEAINNDDIAFLEPIYKEWFTTSGASDQMEFKDLVPQLKDLTKMKLESTEEYDGYQIAHLKGDDGAFNDLVFKDGKYMNEYSNKKLFKKIYSISYRGGKAKIKINGKRSPFLPDAKEQPTIITLINASLKPGTNELTIEGEEITIRISSGTEGEPMNSEAGDVLNYKGKGRVTFTAD